MPPLAPLQSAEDLQTTHVMYPIVLLHGLGQKSHVWEGSALNFYEKEMGLSYGGMLASSNGHAMLQSSGNSSSDFFTVSFTNPTDSVAAWGRELEHYIQLVLEKTKASQVILIGYSMGGLASRYYLTHHVYNHHVKRLITIGTPHLGSPFARIYKVKTALTSRLATNPNIISATALKAALSAVTACESDVAFDAPALHDLMRPEDGGSFLDELGKAEHPSDLDYVSVVGDVDVVGEVQKLNTSAVQELVRRALEFFDSGVAAFFSTGDGVVSSQSQTITNIPWFKNNPQHQRLARTVTLGSVHTAHLINSNEIQRVTLEDRPEFKGAEFALIDGRPFIVIDFSDFLPAAKSTVHVQYTVRGEMQTRVSSTLKLVRPLRGDVCCRALVAMDDADFTQSFPVSISIRNYFGNSATATKQWVLQ